MNKLNITKKDGKVINEYIELTEQEIADIEQANAQAQELYNSDEQKELRYKKRVIELIHEQYSTDDEADLQNNAIDSLLEGVELAQDYIDYRSYVESCKDTAHMEVFEVERT